MIKIKDFFPNAESERLLKEVVINPETVGNILKIANNWLDSHSVEVINIETLLLPNESNVSKTKDFPSQKGFYFVHGKGGGLASRYSSLVS